MRKTVKGEAMAPFPPAAGRPDHPADPVDQTSPDALNALSALSALGVGGPRTPVPGGAAGAPASGGRRWPYIMLLLAVLAAGALSETPPGRGVLRAAGVIGTPAAYTELAFVTPTDLPQQLVAAETTNIPPFVIHNATGAAHRYRWSVTLSSAGTARPSATGETAVAAGAQNTIAPAVRADCRPGPLTVTIALAGDAGSTGDAESISFTADCLATDAGDLS